MNSTMPLPAERPSAVVFDLFGTLVDAPTTHQRAEAAGEIAAVIRVPHEIALEALVGSWTQRHDGSLRSSHALADYLWQRCRPGTPAPEQLATVIRRRAAIRLAPGPGVLTALNVLKDQGLGIGVLSDASADIAEAWAECAFAPVVDAAVFSCKADAVKPHPRLYRLILNELGVTASETIYCGDGGGDELRGAAAAGLSAVRVSRRGGSHALAFGDQPWSGPSIGSITELPVQLTRGRIS